MKKVFWTLTVTAGMSGLMISSAQAVPAFKKEFDTKYVDKNSANPTVKAFSEAAAKANCLICHAKKADGTTDNKVRNAYGQTLEKLLSKKTDIKDAPKIQKALDTVATEKSNPSDASSKTFGDLIKEGKLPGAD
jgi:cytochrome c553